MTPDTTFFRRLMGQFATGVTIVTTRSTKGCVGLTVNSFTSVSLDPLLVLVSIDLRSQSLPLIRESGTFAVNILAEEQEDLARLFASASEERAAYFRQTSHYVAATGAPILAGTLAFIDARITAEYPGGDHALFLGQVEAMGFDNQVVFAPGANSSQSTLPTPTLNNGHSQKHHAHNGHSQPEHSPASPLVYYHGKYRALAQLQAPPVLSTTAQQHEHQ